jgi:hypothetical protein
VEVAGLSPQLDVLNPMSRLSITLSEISVNNNLLIVLTTLTIMVAAVASHLMLSNISSPLEVSH